MSQTTSNAGPSSSPILRVTGEELLLQDIEPTRWIVPGLLPEGLSVLAGRPKKGKSWFALDLAICVAMGKRFLERFDCPSADVLYLALEDGKARLFERLSKLITGQDLPADDEERSLFIQGMREGLKEHDEFLKRLTLQQNSPRLQEGGIEEMKRWHDEHPDGKLIVVDTYGKVKTVNRHSQAMYDQDYNMGSRSESTCRRAQACHIAFAPSAEDACR